MVYQFLFEVLLQFGQLFSSTLSIHSGNKFIKLIFQSCQPHNTMVNIRNNRQTTVTDMTVKNYQPIWTIDDIIVRLLVHIVSLSNVIQFVPKIKSQPATEIRRRNGQNGPRALKANKLMIVSWIVCLLSFCHFF